MNKLNIGATLVGCAIFALAGAVVTAQSAAPDPAMDSKDSSFAKEAASGGMAEVQLGQLAEQKGSNQSVKDFGKRMETDHSAADNKLKTVASKDGITLPKGMNQQDRATYEKLSKLSGAEFDKEYARDMVQDHQKDIAAFQKEANTGANPDVKSFASNTLPTLQDHLRMAQDMQRNVGGQ
jgi:putative membrane protein